MFSRQALDGCRFERHLAQVRQAEASIYRRKAVGHGWPKADPVHRDSLMSERAKTVPTARSIDRSKAAAFMSRAGRRPKYSTQGQEVTRVEAVVRPALATRPAVRPGVGISSAPTAPPQRGTWPNGTPRF